MLSQLGRLQKALAFNFVLGEKYRVRGAANHRTLVLTPKH
jgi:hypothetical protein